jgi:phage repressor protein C with HTH and peptisase S24 domain
MEPKLYHGDSVVFNTADTDLKDGVVYVFNLDGEVVIKRAIRDNGMWWLDSDNPDKARYPRKACTSELCMPLGRVVYMQSERI